MTRRHGGAPVAEDEEFESSGKPEKRLPKPNYPDFKVTREGERQLQCDCGSQSWHLWEDRIVSCATCGLPETSVKFDLLGNEEANFRQEQLMA